MVAAFRSQLQGKKEAIAEKRKKENGSANTSGEGQDGAEDKEGSEEDDVTYQGEEKEDYIITVNEDMGDDDVEEIEDS